MGTGKAGEVAKLIISRLHAELDGERARARDLHTELERERKKYSDVYSEYKYQKAESVQLQQEGGGGEMDESWSRNINKCNKNVVLIEYRYIFSLRFYTKIVFQTHKKKF